MSIKEILFWSVLAYGVGALLLLGLAMLPVALAARLAFMLIYGKTGNTAPGTAPA